MLLSDTSVHDAPTLPSNGFTQLWRACTQCGKHHFSPVMSLLLLKKCSSSSFHLFACLLLSLFVSLFFTLSSSFSLCLVSASLPCVFLSMFWLVPCCSPKRGGRGWGRPSVLLFCLRLQQPLLSLSRGVTDRTTTHSPVYLWKQKRLSQFMLPEFNRDLTVYQKRQNLAAFLA